MWATAYIRDPLLQHADIFSFELSMGVCGDGL